MMIDDLPSDVVHNLNRYLTNQPPNEGSVVFFVLVPCTCPSYCHDSLGLEEWRRSGQEHVYCLRDPKSTIAQHFGFRLIFLSLTTRSAANNKLMNIDVNHRLSNPNGPTL
jgi:hypothetical protein